ncbi:hypothetical protein FB567DRAFT_322725 [Paraphoma chrysanthemicola]|uniref:Uncharacterized protein n=1 Tax=Paraphoma chrysanthemicola TaxID=798071 RepID=A0A8K0W0S1_9PLEO|nr:hypothetical protein FB567DRAFT_322725 [Paraphoma chrysanthemicola]
MSTITIYKPQVGVSARLKDRQLQQYTYTQLRQLSRDRGLDVSRLTEKREIIHTLVEHRLHAVEESAIYVTNTRRRNFFDLLGEIRNEIYNYILIEHDPLFACYELGDCRSIYGVSWIQLLWEPRLSTTYEVVKRLRNISRANCQLHREALSYFYAHNKFRVQSFKSNSFANFLNDIGSHGRANIRCVEFDTPYRTRYGETLFPCPNLRELEVVMPLGYALSGASCRLVHRSLHSLYEELPEGGQTIKLASRMNIFASLPSLRRLILVCMFPPELDEFGFHRSQDLRLEAAQHKACSAIRAQLKRQMASRHVHVEVWPL